MEGIMNRFIVILLFIPQLLWSQELESWNVWTPLEYFIGDWEGQSFGEAGEGTGQRNYQFVMGSSYLYDRNMIEFEPQGNNATGRVHEDLVFFNYDKQRKVITAHRFCNKGIYYKFVLDSVESDNLNLVFVSEYSENALPGLCMRISYKILSPEIFIETIESCFPGKEDTCILTTNWKRKTEL